MRDAFAVLIDEALGSVFAPLARREILAEALAAAELDAIPHQPAALRAFVEGALFSVLTRHLEVRDALETIAQLRATLELALSTVPDEEPGSTVRTITVPAPPSTAWVVTSASLVVFLLADMLGDGIAVAPIAGGAELREQLARVRGRSLLVVIDRKHPSVDLSVCALLREELERESTVVWWGASAAEGEKAAASLAGGPRLIPCGLEVGLADLGELCRSLLDGSS